MRKLRGVDCPVLVDVEPREARLNLGETLAKRVVSTVPPNQIDVIIPIPESSDSQVGHPFRAECGNRRVTAPSCDTNILRPVILRT